MAAFSAAPMPYRNFALSTTGVPTMAQAATQTAASDHLSEAAPAVAFPLLIAALPNEFHFPMQSVQVAAVSKANNSLPAALEESRAEPATAEKGSSSTLRERLPEPVLAAEQSRIVPKSSLQMLLHVPHNPTTRTLKPHSPTPSTASGPTVPLATMFRALRDVAPSRDEQAKPETGLQNMFSRL